MFKAFSALVVGALHHAPERFKLGQPPFRMVTHQRDYLAPPCVHNVPKGSKFHPCPVAKKWKAPVFNFGSGLKNGAVFPAEVNMPDPEFIDTVLKNQHPNQPISPLGVTQDGLDQATHAAQPTRPWKDRRKRHRVARRRYPRRSPHALRRRLRRPRRGVRVSPSKHGYDARG